jgi:hypothetical protein
MGDATVTELSTTTSVRRLIDTYRMACVRIRCGEVDAALIQRERVSHELTTRGLGELVEALLTEHLAQVAVNGHAATATDRELLRVSRQVIRTALAQGDS